jgi:hypothetical protein
VLAPHRRQVGTHGRERIPAKVFEIDVVADLLGMAITSLELKVGRDRVPLDSRLICLKDLPKWRARQRINRKQRDEFVGVRVPGLRGFDG